MWMRLDFHSEVEKSLRIFSSINFYKNVNPFLFQLFGKNLVFTLKIHLSLKRKKVQKNSESQKTTFSTRQQDSHVQLSYYVGCHEKTFTRTAYLPSGSFEIANVETFNVTRRKKKKREEKILLKFPRAVYLDRRKRGIILRVKWRKENYFILSLCTKSLKCKNQRQGDRMPILSGIKAAFDMKALKWVCMIRKPTTSSE